MEHDFTVLLCIGETLDEKSHGISDEILRMQLKIGLHDIPSDKLNQIWVAYEPMWAIGVNGIPESVEYANC